MLPLKSLTPYVLKVEKNRDGKIGVISRGDRGKRSTRMTKTGACFYSFWGKFVSEPGGWFMKGGDVVQ